MDEPAVRPIETEADYDRALDRIVRYFESEPVSGTEEAGRFDALARLIATYEAEHWPIEPPSGGSDPSLKRRER